MTNITISGSAVYVDPASYEPATEVLANGLGSMFSVFMQFLPAIIILSIVIFIVSRFLRATKGGGGHGGVSSFKTSIKN